MEGGIGAVKACAGLFAVLFLILSFAVCAAFAFCLLPYCFLACFLPSAGKASLIVSFSVSRSLFPSFVNDLMLLLAYFSLFSLFFLRNF